MTPEDRLRRAIEERTDSVEPSADGLDRIAAGLGRARRDDRRRKALLGVGAAAAIVAIAVGAAWIASDDESAVVSDAPIETTTVPPTTSTSTTTTTTTPTTTIAPTTTVPPPVVDPAVPIWPRPEGPDHFTDPKELAMSFAVDFVHMTDPVVGELVNGDQRSGDVLVRPTATSPPVVVHVRQLEDDTWYVVGAASEDIRLDTPATGGVVGCPVRLTGEALAFEGVVQVEIRADGVAEPIGSGTVMGGGGPAAPFDGTIECDRSKATSGGGAIVLYSQGGRDDSVWMATVVRVRFG